MAKPKTEPPNDDSKGLPSMEGLNIKLQEVDVFSMVTNLLQAAERSDGQEESSLTATKSEGFYGVITGIHVCDICKKEYANISNLNRHLKKIHKEEVLSVRAKIKCPLCDFGCEFYGNLCRHLEDAHSVTVEREYLVFENEDEFFAWKKRVEKATKASFVKKCGRKKANGKSAVEKMYFYCHRSGEKLQRPTLGKRQAKAQGSCKINSGCPAQITVLKSYGSADSDGKNPLVEVEFVKTHVGHSMDMRHIRLDTEEKAKLASQLADGVTIERVLDSVKKSDDGSTTLDRIQLTTRKDLVNISKRFKIPYKSKNGLSSTKELEEDVASIEAWVRQVHQGDSSPILCYKPEGEVCDDYPTLNAQDFLFGIMNSFQMEMLKLHGDSGIICVDRTHVSFGCDLPLVTVMVVDMDRLTAFPAVFFISNQQDENVMTVFFEQIKNKIGRLRARTFMTDTGRVFYNAWKQVMGSAVEVVFCSWHVEVTWQKKLQQVKHLEEQQNMYRALRVLLEEPDPLVFQQTLDALMCEWTANDQTKRFARFFKQHFASQPNMWAASHRKECPAEAYADLECLHKRLRIVYYEEETLKVKKMDEAISSLMKVLAELEDERRLSTSGGDTAKMVLVRDRHEKGESLDSSNVIVVENGPQPFYLVSASIDGQMYLVQMSIDSCPGCSLTCLPCKACVHRYKCSCNDHTVNGNMCEHIHAVCMKVQNCPIHQQTSVTETDIDETVDNVIVDGSSAFGKTEEVVMLAAEEQDLLQIATAAAVANDQPACQQSESTLLSIDGESHVMASQEEQILIRVFSSGNVGSSNFIQEKKVLEDKAEQLLSKIKTCRNWDELNNIKHVFLPMDQVEMVVQEQTEDEIMLDGNNMQAYIVTEKCG